MIFQAVVLQLVITTVDMVLLMRGTSSSLISLCWGRSYLSVTVYALYNKSRSLIVALSIAFLAEIAYLSYNLGIVTPKLGFSDDCFVTSSPPTFVAYWYVTCHHHRSPMI